MSKVDKRKNRPKIIDIPKEYLIEEYINKNKTMQLISKELGCGLTTIKRRLVEYGLFKDFSRIGTKYGKLTVLECTKTENKQKYFKCICDCGKVVIRNAVVLYSKDRIPSCGCLRAIGQKHSSYSGYEEISGAKLSQITLGAKKRNIEYNVTPEYIWNLFLQQNKKCALSGLDLNFVISAKNKRFETASLDRIDNTKGYIEGNVQWLHKKVNLMKHISKTEDFVEMCCFICHNMENKLNENY